MKINAYRGFGVLLTVLFLTAIPVRVFAIGSEITSITTQTISTAPFSIGGIAGDSQFAGGIFTLNFAGNVQSITEFTFSDGKAMIGKKTGAKVYVRRSPVTDSRQNGYYQGTLDPGTNTFNFSSAGPFSEQELFDLNNILAGPDNVFTNTGANLGGVPYNGNVSIERVDFVLEKKVTVNDHAAKDKDKDEAKGVGFAIFERGAPTGHDGFGIAAITGVDELGHPTSYGPVYIVPAGSWGLTPLVVPIPQYYFLNNAAPDHPGLPINPALTIPSNQTFGGVLIRADELVASGHIYGYSLFGPDVACTPETLVNVADACFPKNTGVAGGIDLGSPNLGILSLQK